MKVTLTEHTIQTEPETVRESLRRLRLRMWDTLEGLKVTLSQINDMREEQDDL